jgi:Predicted amidohydrolase
VKRRCSVALGQMAGVIGDVRHNLRRAEEMIAEAGQQGADMICLPELFATGYNLNMLGEDILHLSRAHYQEIHTRMAGAAAKSGIYVIAPYGLPQPDGRVHNAASVYTPNGELLGRYAKARAFGGERHYFANGEDFPVFDTAFGRMGILICYDAGFPEFARALCNAGAELIVIPAAWRIQDIHSWMLNVPSRALENQLFTVGVNRAGKEGDLHLFGRSLVCDPWGRIQKQLPDDKDCVETACIDLADVARCRAEGGYLQDL